MYISADTKWQITIAKFYNLVESLVGTHEETDYFDIPRMTGTKFSSYGKEYSQPCINSSVVI